MLLLFILNSNLEKVKRLRYLNQKYQDFELIIIDDGSTDDSKKVIENYRNYSKIKIIYQKNKGLNVTNNIATRISKGKYIVRLDADDFFHEDAIQQLVNQLEKDSSLVAVFPDYAIVDQEGNVLH